MSVDFRYLRVTSLDLSIDIETVVASARTGNAAVAMQKASNRTVPLNACPANSLLAGLESVATSPREGLLTLRVPEGLLHIPVAPRIPSSKRHHGPRNTRVQSGPILGLPRSLCKLRYRCFTPAEG